MKNFLALGLLLLATPALATNETGPANSILRVPTAGGRATMGSINLGVSAAVGTTKLLPINGGSGLDNSGATGVQKYAAGTGSVATVVNADISSSAAIARTKIASSTVDRILFNDHSTGVPNDLAGFTFNSSTSAMSVPGSLGIGSAPLMPLDVYYAGGSQGAEVAIASKLDLGFYVDDTVATFTGSTRTATINAGRLDGGTLPKLRLAGQNGLQFAADANTVHASMDGSGNWAFSDGQVLVGTQSGGGVSSSVTALTLGGIPYENTSSGNSGWLRFSSNSNRTASDRTWGVLNNQITAGDLGFYVGASAGTDPVIYSATPDKPYMALSGSSPLAPKVTLNSSFDGIATTGQILGELDFNSNDTSTNATGVAVAIRALTTGTLQSGSTDSAIQFSTRPATGNANAQEQMRLTADGYLQMSGVANKSVTVSSGNAERIERVIIANGGSCSVTSQSNSGGTNWVSTTVAHPATGGCVLAMNGTPFSAAPTCVVTAVDGTPGRNCKLGETTGASTPPSTTNIYVVCENDSGTLRDGGFQMLCMGPR